MQTNTWHSDALERQTFSRPERHDIEDIFEETGEVQTR
jgi:hypothetical protein